MSKANLLLSWKVIMQQIKNFGRRFFVNPIVEILSKSKVEPNLITISSLVFACLSFFFYYRGIFWAGAIFLFVVYLIRSTAKLHDRLSGLQNWAVFSIPRLIASMNSSSISAFSVIIMIKQIMYSSGLCVQCLVQ